MGGTGEARRAARRTSGSAGPRGSFRGNVRGGGGERGVGSGEVGGGMGGTGPDGRTLCIQCKKKYLGHIIRSYFGKTRLVTT